MKTISQTQTESRTRTRPARSLSLAAAVVAIATLTACAAPGPAYETARYPYQPHSRPVAQAPYVDYGRIANIEVVRSETQGSGPSGGGAIAGGLVGGVVGNQFGGGGGRAAMTALGLVGGALLGGSRTTSCPDTDATTHARQKQRSRVMRPAFFFAASGSRAASLSAAGRCPASWARR